jgi:hypothetical protein
VLMRITEDVREGERALIVAHEQILVGLVGTSQPVLNILVLIPLDQNLQSAPRGRFSLPAMRLSPGTCAIGDVRRTQDRAAKDMPADLLAKATRHRGEQL